ncbi:ABC transporter permease [Desertimonas flava]|uniref:ABC transporter permease n=1 Tax=Desertimonas flava TaxID=2064846 RepID=UPI000E34A94F|nr:ABC transporter permease subunit [Desertimonas flava]
MRPLGTWRLLLATVAGIVVLGGLWEFLVRLFDVRPFILLPPSRIIEELSDAPRFYLEAAAVTSRHAGLGLLMALAIAVILGAVLASWRFLEAMAQPLLVLILVAPWVAYFTSLLAWLGPGDPPVYFLVTFVTVPAFTFAVVAGLRSSDPAARELLASVNASRAEVLWRLRLPSALPGILAAGRYVIGLALAAAYYGEGGNLDTEGLGSIGRRAGSGSNGPLLWASVFATVALGVAGLAILATIERVALRWHVSQRQGSTATGPRWLP